MIELISVRTDLLLSDALALFAEMRKLGLERDVMVYTSLMRALVRTGRTNDAWRLFEEMKTESVLIAKEATTGKTTESHQTREGSEETKEMEEVPLYIDAKAYTTMLRGLCEVGELKRAYALFQEMGEIEKRESITSNNRRRQSQRKRLTRKGHHSTVKEEAGLPTTSSLVTPKPSTPFIRDTKAFTTMLHGFVQKTYRIDQSEQSIGHHTGDDSKSEEHSNNNEIDAVELDDDDPSYYHFEMEKQNNTGPRSAVNYSVHQQNIETAWELFDEAKRSNMELDTRAYSMMLEGLCRLDGGAPRLNALFQEMELSQELKVDGHAYRSMVEAGCNEGTEEGKETAIRWFERMCDCWRERGVNDRDLNVIEKLLDEHLGEKKWMELSLKNKEAIEGIATGHGHTSMVRLPRMIRKISSSNNNF